MVEGGHIFMEGIEKLEEGKGGMAYSLEDIDA